MSRCFPCFSFDATLCLPTEVGALSPVLSDHMVSEAFNIVCVITLTVRRGSQKLELNQQQRGVSV